MSLSVRVSGQAEFTQIKREVRDLDRNLRGLEGTIKKSSGHGFFPKDQMRMAEHTIQSLITGQKRLNSLLDEQRTKVYDTERLYNEASGEHKKRLGEELAKRREILKVHEEELAYIRRKTTELQKQTTQLPAGGSPAGGSGDIFSMIPALRTVLSLSSKILGMAGIMGGTALASQGINLAGQQQTAFARLAMRTGEYNRVQGYTRDVRDVGLPLGYTATQSAQMMEAYTSRAGAMTLGDLQAQQRFTRGYGLEGTQVAGTFAEASRMGAFGEGEQKQFANMIAFAIDEGRMQERAVEAMESTVGLLGDLGRRLPEVSGAGVVALQTLLNQSGIEGLRGERGADILSRLDSMFDSSDPGSRFTMLRALGWGEDKTYYEAELQREKGISDVTNLQSILSYIESTGYNQDVRNLMVQRYSGLSLNQIEALRQATGSGFEGIMSMSQSEFEKMAEDYGIDIKAEHWSETLGAKFETSVAKFDQAVTDFGSHLLPMVNSIRDAVTEGINALIPDLPEDPSALNPVSIGTAGLALGGAVLGGGLLSKLFRRGAPTPGTPGTPGTPVTPRTSPLRTSSLSTGTTGIPLGMIDDAMFDLDTKRAEAMYSQGFIDKDQFEKFSNRRPTDKSVLDSLFTLHESDWNWDEMRKVQKEAADIQKELNQAYNDFVKETGQNIFTSRDAEKIINSHEKIERKTTLTYDEINENNRKHLRDVFSGQRDYHRDSFGEIEDMNKNVVSETKSSGERIINFLSGIGERAMGFLGGGIAGAFGSNFNPFSDYRVSSSFGMRQGRLHAGTDYAMPQGTPLQSVGSGIIQGVRSDPGGYGTYIDKILDTGELTRYAHLSRVNVEKGQRVGAGQIIGATGGTPGTPGAGSSTGAHLHFEVRDQDGNPIDPEKWFPKQGVTSNINISLDVKGNIDALTRQSLGEVISKALEEAGFSHMIQGTVTQ